MKVCTAIVATALTVSSVVASLPHHVRSGHDDSEHRMLKQTATTAAWISQLTTIPNTDSYHMKPVRSLQARVQGDAPAWDATNGLFTSAYGADFASKFRASLDTVNTASVEGALMYVQAEGINYNSRAVADQCVRKNKMQYVVFYDIVFAQTNETLALYETEYGPFLPMDGGQCTPTSGADATAVFSKPCDYINGDNGQPQIGAFVGGELKDTDPRAPYPNTYWYSFPNTAVKLKWGAKNDTNRAASRRGLCDFDKMPDGITCTYNYRISGWVPIDDVVGITAMKSKAGTATYKNFTEFCLDGGLEFNATVSDGTWIDGLAFWAQPQNRTANAARAAKVVDTYTAMLASKTSSQISTTVIANMAPLPTIADLTSANPKCYENSKECTGSLGCKRTFYGQLCVPCTASDTGCDIQPSTSQYPTLTKAVGTTGSSGDKTANGTATSSPTTTTPTTTTTPSTTTPTPTPSTTAKSGAASVSIMGFASVATLALTFLFC
ncbi:hypothetical protein Gpo141_00002714 [Globisporangium polare]